MPSLIVSLMQKVGSLHFDDRAICACDLDCQSHVSTGLEHCLLRLLAKSVFFNSMQTLSALFKQKLSCDVVSTKL